MESLFILGRQPALGLAELESLFDAGAVKPWGQSAALVGLSPDNITFSRLGGSIKGCRVLTVLDTTDMRKIETALLKLVPQHAAGIEGKVQLGLSTYGLDVTPQRLLASGLTLKKTLRKSGHSVRLTPNSEPALNSASVLHNNLTGANGIEIVMARDGSQTVIARTTAAQDIDSYTRRDRGRPKRDARIGMLPPKLAQIIINLAVAQQSPSKDFWILDPFCGTGVILQEATLMGFDVYGSDLDKRMVEYTDINLMWLLEQPECPVRFSKEQKLPPSDNTDWRYFKLEAGDATEHIWKPAPNAVACETYLGKPFTTLPGPDILATTINDCNLIIKKFLRNISAQIPAGTRLCLAVPAWQVRPGQFRHLPLLANSQATDAGHVSGVDHLSDLGYNRISFEHVRPEELLYYRADQIVARQLLVIQKQ